MHLLLGTQPDCPYQYPHFTDANTEATKRRLNLPNVKEQGRENKTGKKQGKGVVAGGWVGGA